MTHEQEQLFDPDEVNFLLADPYPVAAEGARRFSGGSWRNDDLGQTTAPGAAGYSVYRTFEKGQQEETSPEMKRSYAALRSHLGEQFDFITRPETEGGLGINVEVTDRDPYTGDTSDDAFRAMHADVTANRRLKIWGTDEGDTGGHPELTADQNNQFRAVHDLFGHLATGRGFDRHGEEAAFLSHRRMMPEEAHLALASELRGQNAYLNWGGEDFPENVPSNMPRWAAEEQVSVPQPKPRNTEKYEQLRLDV